MIFHSITVLLYTVGMADVKPTKVQTTKAPAAKAKKEDENLTPQELEAKKAKDDAKIEEERQETIRRLIKTKKYFLPIK